MVFSAQHPRPAPAKNHDRRHGVRNPGRDATLGGLYAMDGIFPMGETPHSGHKDSLRIIITP
jgi:hypothetical protein